MRGEKGYFHCLMHTFLFGIRIQNNAKSTVEDYVVGRSDDMRDLIDRAVAGYDMVSLAE